VPLKNRYSQSQIYILGEIHLFSCKHCITRALGVPNVTGLTL